MFTGLIADVGKVFRREMRKGSGVLVIQSRLLSKEMVLGSSIAVNGACLTVVDKAGERFTVDVSPETLERTTLKQVRRGDLVNLELPLRLNDRLGGHWVTGHVDGIGTLRAMRKKGKFTFLSFEVSEALSRLIVSKGSVAVDGISLTVNDCEGLRFSVAIIPFTLKHTNLRQLRLGDRVNIEVDILGKYVQKFLAGRGWESGTEEI